MATYRANETLISPSPYPALKNLRGKAPGRAERNGRCSRRLSILTICAKISRFSHRAFCSIDRVWRSNAFFRFVQDVIVIFTLFCPLLFVESRVIGFLVEIIPRGICSRLTFPDRRFGISGEKLLDRFSTILLKKQEMEDKIFHLFRTRSNEEVDLDNFLTIRFRFNEEKIFLPQR